MLVPDVTTLRKQVSNLFLFSGCATSCGVMTPHSVFMCFVMVVVVVVCVGY